MDNNENLCHGKSEEYDVYLTLEGFDSFEIQPLPDGRCTCESCNRSFPSLAEEAHDTEL